MARLKPVKQGVVMLVVDFDKRIRPCTFEHTLCHVVNQCLDLWKVCTNERGP